MVCFESVVNDIKVVFVVVVNNDALAPLLPRLEYLTGPGCSKAA